MTIATATPAKTTPAPSASKPKADQPKPAAVAAAPKAEPKPKTPEQRAAALRREAGELRRTAKVLGEENGKHALALATNREAEADALAPRKGKSTESRPICAGTKKDGSTCTAHAMEGSTFCTDHRPVESRFSADQKAAFGRVPFAVLVDRLGWGVALKLANAQLEAEKANKA